MFAVSWDDDLFDDDLLAPEHIDALGRCAVDAASVQGVERGGEAPVCPIVDVLDAGAEGAVVGLAMYTNVISPWEWDTPWQV